MDRKTWLKSGEYLPRFMRDFHDAKRLFKRVHEMVYNAREKEPDNILVRKDFPNWMTAQIYVVDFFLWYMGSCGYTLQKTHKRIADFVDLDADMRAWWKRELERMATEFDAIRESAKQKEGDNGR